MRILFCQKVLKLSDFCDTHDCLEMGLERVATRRIPCRLISKLPCKAGVLPQNQLQFQKVQKCEFKSVLGDENNWFFPELNQRARSDAKWEELMDNETDVTRTDLWNHLTGEIVDEIVKREIGAVVTLDPKTDGHCLVEWTSLRSVC